MKPTPAPHSSHLQSSFLSTVDGYNLSHDPVGWLLCPGSSVPPILKAPLGFRVLIPFMLSISTHRNRQGIISFCTFCSQAQLIKMTVYKIAELLWKAWGSRNLRVFWGQIKSFCLGFFHIWLPSPPPGPLSTCPGPMGGCWASSALPWVISCLLPLLLTKVVGRGHKRISVPSFSFYYWPKADRGGKGLFGLHIDVTAPFWGTPEQEPGGRNWRASEECYLVAWSSGFHPATFC